MAPLRHLLLVRAMGVDLERFFHSERFDPVSKAVQPPPGPWPCLNAVCERRGQLTIIQADREPLDTNGTEHLVLKCPHCGFAYKIRDDAGNPTRANCVVDYGPQWHDTLKANWADATVTLRKMAQILGVDPKTVSMPKGLPELLLGIPVMNCLGGLEALLYC